jgi:UDP-glucose 4-epimerase
MAILVTGSAGHLGEALMRTLSAARRAAICLDLKLSVFTHAVGAILDRAFVERCMGNVDAVVHTATLARRASLPSRTIGQKRD